MAKIIKDSDLTIKELYNREWTYKDEFYRKLDRLFIWESENEEFKFPKRMELLLHQRGSLGYDLIHKCWVKGYWDGVVDENNDYTTYVCTTLSTNPQSYSLTNHKEVVVCGNNTIYTDDNYDNKWYANILEETDISIYYQLINSRNIPMLASADDNIKKEVEIAFKKLKAGKPVVITTGLMDEVKTLDILDPNSIEKISTLDNFHEEMLKRWCNKYGVDVETKEKKAQVNTMELDSFGDYSSLNFLEMYEARLEFVEEMNENGYNISCVRNPIYWDEPTDTDIEEGTFEDMEEGGQEDAEENNSTEGNSSDKEDEQPASNDDE